MLSLALAQLLEALLEVVAEALPQTQQRCSPVALVTRAGSQVTSVLQHSCFFKQAHLQPHRHDECAVAQGKLFQGPNSPDHSTDMIGVGFGSDDTVMYSDDEEEWSIAVLEPWGGVQTLTVYTDWKVRHVKELMQTLTGVRCQDQQLTYAGQTLLSHSRIREGGLCDGCKVNIVVQQSSWQSHRLSPLVQIFIKPLHGTCHPVWINPKHTVRQLKESLHLLVGPVPERQRLIVAGQMLQANYSLLDYGLKEGYTLHLIIRKDARM